MKIDIELTTTIQLQINGIRIKQTAYKYEWPYTGSFVITQFLNNGTVNLQCVPKKIRYDIRRIKPYKCDTKVEDISSKVCLTMSVYYCQFYNFVLTIKA